MYIYRIYLSAWRNSATTAIGTASLYIFVICPVSLQSLIYSVNSNDNNAKYKTVLYTGLVVLVYKICIKNTPYTPC